MLMNERIKELAQQAGLKFSKDWGECYTGNVQIERFAELVRQDLYQVIGKSVIEQINSAVQIERQACAALADEFDDDVGQAISKAIRARGNT